MAKGLGTFTDGFLGEEEECGKPVDVEDEEPASSPVPLKSIESERVECVAKDDPDGGGFWPRVGEFTRTNTDMTLVEGDEEHRGLALKV